MLNNQIKPLVSVIMSVYKVERSHLSEAVMSILGQSFRNFEFIIILDGDNKHLDYLKSITDERIIILINKSNMGLPYSLNRGINYSKGIYIMRMDADDVSLIDRLEKQLLLLQNRYPIISSGCYLVDKNTEIIGKSKSFLFLHNLIRRFQLYILMENPVIHSSIAAHRRVYDDFKYDESFVYAQDLELWLRMSKKYRIYFDDRPLIKYRRNDSFEKNLLKNAYTNLARNKNRKI
jgi:glycosyltransferase involved in cell wall biosynthesis